MTLSFTPGGSVSEYLHRYERNELLRFLTCGSVDDGKSTLIGRLLHDTGRLYDDHLKAIEAESKVHGTQGGALDLALVVDGLKAEREQGITIDVAYRYFATAHRSFIIADCPGHEQYTRNMATGASHCQLAITLIDARSGVTTQTRRHAFIASLLGICHVVAAVNKMDLVAWGEGRFREIESEFLDYCVKVGIAGPIAVPVSATLFFITSCTTNRGVVLARFKCLSKRLRLHDIRMNLASVGHRRNSLSYTFFVDVHAKINA